MKHLLRNVVVAMALVSCVDSSKPGVTAVDGPFPNILYPTAKVWSITLDSGGVLAVDTNNGVAAAAWRPVYGARYYWTCDDFGVYPYSTNHSGYADKNGLMSMVCPVNTQMIFGFATLDSGYADIDTMGYSVPAREFSFSDFDGDPIQEDTVTWPIIAAAPYAAIHDVAIRAASVFTTYTSPHKVKTKVSRQYSAGGAYDQSVDTIVVWIGTGTYWPSDYWYYFVHEYGHAFYDQNGGSFNHTDQTDLVEPFAEVFTAHLAGWRLICTEDPWCYGLAPLNRTSLERDSAGSWLAAQNEDGSNVSGNLGARAAVTSFLYDLIDGTADSNGVGNAPGDDDESITYGGKYVMDLLTKCNVDPVPLAGTGTVKARALSHLIACAEHTIAVRGDVPSAWRAAWDSVASYSETITEPAGWNASKIRQLWKFDVFHVGSLP